MTYREKLIEFIKMKDLIVHKTSSMEYVNEKDMEDIQSWSEKTCLDIYKHMTKFVIEDDNDDEELDYNTCPWCIKYLVMNSHNDCTSCRYGSRHGICSKIHSKYRELHHRQAFYSLDKAKYREILNSIELINSTEKRVTGNNIY